jgi:hypothetical protein
LPIVPTDTENPSPGNNLSITLSQTRTKGIKALLVRNLVRPSYDVRGGGSCPPYLDCSRVQTSLSPFRSYKCHEINIVVENGMVLVIKVSSNHKNRRCCPVQVGIFFFHILIDINFNITHQDGKFHIFFDIIIIRLKFVLESRPCSFDHHTRASSTTSMSMRRVPHGPDVLTIGTSSIAVEWVWQAIVACWNTNSATHPPVAELQSYTLDHRRIYWGDIREIAALSVCFLIQDR